MSICQKLRPWHRHLERKLQYDSQPRKSLLDHFWPVDISLEPLVAGRVVDAGDFLDGVYEPRIRRNPDRVQLLMVRSGKVQTGASGPVDVKLTKAVTLEAGSPALQISYLLEGLPATVPLHFGIEFHFAGLAAGAPDRFFYTDHEDHLGPLESQLDLADVELIGLVDQWLGLDVALGFSQPSGIWTFPIQTVSNSERGFELVHQSTAVVPHWLVEADAQGRWRIEITLSADTSAAEARQHPAAAPV